MPTFIYALTDPRTDEVRYIGKSVEPEFRLYMHIWYARKTDVQYHSSRWIRTLLADGVEPGLKIVEEITSGCWKERERYWIAHYLPTGLLTNITSGGEGICVPRTAEWNRRIGEAQKGRVLSKEQVDRMRNQRLGMRGTHCKHGHEFTPENSSYNVMGHRSCRECSRISCRKRRALVPKKASVPRKPKSNPVEICSRGHEMSGENLRLLTRTGMTGRDWVERICRACVRIRNTESKRRARARKKQGQV